LASGNIISFSCVRQAGKENDIKKKGDRIERKRLQFLSTMTAKWFESKIVVSFHSHVHD